MRNLKRALSLTLASVMLLGMMIVGTSAVSFNDADDITNVTAATILQDLEIMVGDGENFMPNQVVTRGQMAIIVCKILYGDKLNVSQFSDATQYTDVAVGDYFNGYVNLATSLGIISGYGNGQFGPGDPVTTAQAALMLTKALGYFKGGELKGDWAVDSLAAITKATDLKMFADMKAPASNEGLTRDNVANMVFNTITKAVTVEYNANFDIYFNTGAAWANGVIFRYDDTLGFQRFDLVYKTKADGLGRPQTRWGVGSVNKTAGYLDNYGNLVSSQVIIADRDAIVDVNNTPLATYNTKLVTDDNYNDDFKYTGSATSTPSSTSLTTIKNDLDGYLVGAQTSDGYTTLHINGGTQSMKYANIPAAAQDIASRGIGDGVQIYVYANNSSEITDIVVVEQQLAKVTAVNDKKQTITLALSGDHQATGTESSAIIDSTSSLYTKLTDAKVAVGDYLLVVMNGKTVKTADIPETVTGVVKAYTNRGALTMDGTKYNASISKIKVATETNDLADPREYEDTTSTAILYLDACGNVVAVKGDIDSKIVYVGRTDGEDGFSSVLKAYVFFADGGKGVYTVASYNGSTDSEDINLVKEGLYLYSANGQEISLKDMGNNGGSGTSALNSSVWFISTKPNDADGADNSQTMSINENTTSYAITGVPAANGSKVYVDKNTIFFTHNTTTDSHKEAPSDAVKTDFINVSTGLKSLDDTLDGSYTTLTNVSVLCKIVDGKYLALAVYGENAQNVAAASNDLVYVSDNNWSTENSSTYSSDAVFTGDKEAQNIKFKGQNKIGLYTYTEKDGVYDLKLATPDNCAYGNKDGAGTLAANGVKLTKVGNNLDFTSDSSMTPSSLNIDKDVLVFDEDLNVVDTGILSSKECYGHVVVDNTRDKNVIAIYIAKTYDKGEDPANPPSQAPVAVDTPDAIAAKFDVTFSDGSDSKNLQAGDTATLIIKDKAGKTRAAGAPADKFVLNNYYKVTVNGEVKDVQCTVAHQLTVTYTVKAADLAAGARKIQVTAIVEAAAPATTPVTAIAITGDDTVVKGSNITLAVTVTPENATNKEVTWSIPDTTGVTIDQTGKLSVTAEATAASVVVTATAKDGSGVKGTKTITIADEAVAVESIKIQKNGVDATTDSVEQGETATYTVAFTPANATDKNITWKVEAGTAGSVASGTKVENGVLTVAADQATGTLTVTATTANSKTASVTVTVTAADVQPTKYKVTVTGVDDYTVAGIDSNGYAKDASVSITLTQKVATDLAKDSKFTVTSSDVAVEGTVTTAGVAAVKAKPAEYEEATGITDENSFNTAKAAAKGGKLYKEVEGEKVEAETYEADTTYFTLKTEAVEEVTAIPGVITITFTMPEKNVSITGIAPKA